MKSGNCRLALVAVFLISMTPLTYAEVIFEEDFEDGGNDWSADNGVWKVGTPSAGPEECQGGAQCGGTVLDDSYPGDTDSRLISPPIELPAVDDGEEITLSFWQWFSYGACDKGYVQIRDWDPDTLTWSIWSSLDGSIYNNSPWSRRLDDLTAHAGEIVQVAIYHTADSYIPGISCSSGGSGWFVDDLEITRRVPVFTGDFETGWDDWGADRGVWQIGPPSAGPAICGGGDQCAGTVLDGNYPGDTDSSLISAPIQLPSTIDILNQRPSLRFWHWFSYGACDQGTVRISVWDQDSESWSGWRDIGSASGSSDWAPKQIGLYPYAGEIVRIAFYHTADSYIPGISCSSRGAGWYIDHIRLPGVFLVPCEHDLDNDGDVDGSDLARFSDEFGRADCSIEAFCYDDTDQDGDVDGSDLAIFSGDFGKTTCFDDPPFPAGD